MLNFQHDDSRIRSPSEVSAGVTPVNYAYPPGDIRRYGTVDITGAVDSSAAINTAFTVSEDVLFPAGKIRWDTAPDLASLGISSLRMFGAGAGSGPAAALRTRLYVKNQYSGSTGFTLEIDDAADLMELTMEGIEFDGSNGDADPLTNGSTTWLGAINITKTTGNGCRLVKIRDCHFHGTLGNNALLNLALSYAVEIYGCQITQAPNGYGVVAGGTSNISTNITLTKCYLALIRQPYKFNANCTDATFNDCIVESSNVVGHANNTKVTFSHCYFENIGYDPLSLSRAGIDKMSDPITFGNALDSTNCDAAFTQLYGTLTINDCRFTNQVATLPGIVQCIGIGSLNGADGALIVNGGTNTSTVSGSVPFFRAVVFATERSNFIYRVYDPSRPINSSLGMVKQYADLRLISDGCAWVSMADATQRFIRIYRGKFIYGYGIENSYTGPLTTQPSGGQNEKGDAVLMGVPAVGVYQWMCSTAGSPGTWEAIGFSAPRTVSVTYSASMAIDASQGTVFEITANNGTAFTINTPTNPTVGKRITIRIYNTSGGALGAVTWAAGGYKMSAWTQPANGFNRSIDFEYSSVGGGFWYQSSQTGVDVAN